MIKISIIIYTNFFYKEKTMTLPKTLLAREPEIINQTENLKILVGLYTSLNDFVDLGEEE